MVRIARSIRGVGVTAIASYTAWSRRPNSSSHPPLAESVTRPSIAAATAAAARFTRPG